MERVQFSSWRRIRNITVESPGFSDRAISLVWVLGSHPNKKMEAGAPRRVGRSSSLATAHPGAL